MSRHSLKAIRWVAIAFLFLCLNYIWELAHSRLFTNYADIPRIDHALDCLQHSLTDLLIGTGTYLATALLFRSLTWMSATQRWWPGVVWIASGLIVTVGIEIWATSIGRWGYPTAMPTLLGIGVTPLLQWIVIPTVALLVARRLFHCRPSHVE